MSDFQKQTLKRYARNFLIVCGVALADSAGSIQKDLLLIPHGLTQRKKTN